MKVVKGKMIKMKIALVKQDVYQDLYVGNKDMSLVELLYSSAGRVGPISLFDEYDCDFLYCRRRKYFRMPCVGKGYAQNG